MKTEKNEVFRTAYKSMIISGTLLLTNDVANYYTCGRSATPIGKIVRNLAACAIGFNLGSKIADFSYEAIERAVDKYRED